MAKPPVAVTCPAPTEPEGATAPRSTEDVDLSPAIVKTRATCLISLETEWGIMICEIFERQAPVTSAHFLALVRSGGFDGATFYRTVRLGNQRIDGVKVAVIQGGLGLPPSRPMPAIEHETTRQTGLTHLDGTLSMARMAVGTASTEFFLCIGDQPELDFGGARNPDGQGFAAFGRLIDGADVARSIHRRPQRDQMLHRPVLIASIRRMS